jgi:hypothetical protein
MKTLNETTPEAAVEAARQEVEAAKLTQPVNGQKFWLVTYATTHVADDYNTLNHHGVVEAADIKAAEREALDRHANEGFSCEEPFGPEDNEEGRWIIWQGFRAFKLSENHAAVDVGDVLWVEHICEIPAADAQVLIKHLHRDLTYEQQKAEEAEQLRLRGVARLAKMKAANNPRE